MSKVFWIQCLGYVLVCILPPGQFQNTDCVDFNGKPCIEIYFLLLAPSWRQKNYARRVRGGASDQRDALDMAYNYYDYENPYDNLTASFDLNFEVEWFQPNDPQAILDVFCDTIFSQHENVTTIVLMSSEFESSDKDKLMAQYAFEITNSLGIPVILWVGDNTPLFQVGTSVSTELELISIWM